MAIPHDDVVIVGAGPAARRPWRSEDSPCAVWSGGEPKLYA